jgi:hypothetical protein
MEPLMANTAPICLTAFVELAVGLGREKKNRNRAGREVAAVSECRASGCQPCVTLADRPAT